jgi:hypothetical protein
MQAVTTIGLDIAKSVFQIHGVDAAGCFIASLVTGTQSAGAHRAGSIAPPHPTGQQAGMPLDHGSLSVRDT